MRGLISDFLLLYFLDFFFHFFVWLNFYCLATIHYWINYYSWVVTYPLQYSALLLSQLFDYIFEVIDFLAVSLIFLWNNRNSKRQIFTFCNFLDFHYLFTFTRPFLLRLLMLLLWHLRSLLHPCWTQFDNSHRFQFWRLWLSQYLLFWDILVVRSFGLS